MTKLFIRNWPVAPATPLRGVVVLVHGLGEHIGRYEHVAKFFNAQGFAVRGYDHYGHGQSEGARGDVRRSDQLLDDLGDVIDLARQNYGEATPLILCGHSMGGVVVGRFVSLKLRKVDGLVMSSPALALGLSSFQKLLLKVMPVIAPHLTVANGLDAKKICTNAAVVQAYINDPLVHNKLAPILARFILDAGIATRAAASQWDTPTLLLYAGKDFLVSPKGSAAFAASAPAVMVQAHCFETMYHEIFNEVEQAKVFDMLGDWLVRF